MILGTVELGMAYGINSAEGKPSEQQAIEVLRAAQKGGIKELDTAAAYGDSEEIIGRFQEAENHPFIIGTKLPVAVEKDTFPACFEAACKRLKTKKIETLYLHSFKQCSDQGVVAFLEDLKDRGKVNHIGISIYEPEEMKFILDFMPMIDTIQFPFNVLDNYRWQKNNLLDDASDKQKRLLSRSVFLQGLIFRDPADLFVKSLGAERAIYSLTQISKEADMSIAELAYSYVRQNKQIDDILVGCQNVADVDADLQLENVSIRKLPNSIVKKIEEISSKTPIEAIDPRRWIKK